MLASRLCHSHFIMEQTLSKLFYHGTPATLTTLEPHLSVTRKCFIYYSITMNRTKPNFNHFYGKKGLNQSKQLDKCDGKKD